MYTLIQQTWFFTHLDRKRSLIDMQVTCCLGGYLINIIPQINKENGYISLKQNFFKDLISLIWYIWQISDKIFIFRSAGCINLPPLYSQKLHKTFRLERCFSNLSSHTAPLYISDVCIFSFSKPNNVQISYVIKNNI